MINITHILWKRKAVGVALSKLKNGENIINITVKDKSGTRLVADPVKVTKEKLLNIYDIETINKRGLEGVFIPLADITRGVFNA